MASGTNVRNTHTAICIYHYSEDGYGNLVKMLDTDNWWQAFYAHLSSFYEPNLEEWGDPLPQGWTIGWSGNTGYGTGDHLHYHVQTNSTLAAVYLGGMQGLSLNGNYPSCGYSGCPPDADFACVCGQVN